MIFLRLICVFFADSRHCSGCLRSVLCWVSLVFASIVLRRALYHEVRIHSYRCEARNSGALPERPQISFLLRGLLCDILNQRSYNFLRLRY